MPASKAVIKTKQHISLNNENFFSTWSGVILANKGKIKVFIQVIDWNFTVLPDLYIMTPLPIWLKSCLPMAHINPFLYQINKQDCFNLCYSIADAQELTRIDPVKIIKWVIFQARKIINEMTESSTHRQQELFREIVPMWESFHYQQMLSPQYSEIQKLSMSMVLDNIPKEAISITEKQWVLKTGNEDHKYNIQTFILIPKSKKIPLLEKIMLDQVEFSTTSEQLNFRRILLWLKKWDRVLQFEFLKLLDEYYQAMSSNMSFVFCCIIVNEQPLPFILDLSKSIRNNKIKYQEEVIRKKGLSAISDKITVIIQAGINISPEFVYQRNLVNMEIKNLEKLKIAIIGIGAIGGYLALSLARLGAGTGGGEICLNDPDAIKEHNIGRHVLGKNYLGHNKAEAMKTELELQLVNLIIKTIPKNILKGEMLELESLSKYDLIIDATGKMEVSETLNHFFQNLRKSKILLLHLWIRGNGECVQGLLVEKDSSYACRSCIQQAGYPLLDQFNALLGHEAEHAFLACNDFTPYSVSSSMAAAALGCDMTLEWANGQNSPRYRTRYVERWQGRKLESEDIPKSPTCRFCNH